MRLKSVLEGNSKFYFPESPDPETSGLEGKQK